MPNTLTITVEEPDKILNAGAYGAGAVVRLQTATTEAGAFGDVSGTGSTPTIAVVSGTRSYDGYDPNGTVSSWYRTRFENVGATRASDWSPAFQTAPEGSGLICSLWDVKQELTLTGTTTNDELLLEKIRQVGAEIMGYTKRRFVRTPASGTTTFLFDVEDHFCRELDVPAGIAEATTLEVATQTGGSYTTVPASEWFLRPTTADREYGWPATRICLSEYSSSWFWPGYATVRVTMALGFEAVPYDVQAIAQRAVIGSYMSKGNAEPRVYAGPTGAMTILRNISPADQMTLTRYMVIP